MTYRRAGEDGADVKKIDEPFFTPQRSELQMTSFSFLYMAGTVG